MKVLLDIRDNKALFVMELLKNLSFVKTNVLTPAKAQILEELKESIEEVKLAEGGKIKLKSADEFLNELHR
jgi:hypothetical protein